VIGILNTCSSLCGMEKFAAVDVGYIAEGTQCITDWP